jgi:hypothetical protein
LHTFPSEQLLVLSFVKTHPVAGTHASSVQGLLSLHTGTVPGWQTPAKHVSTPLHASPSAQEFVLSFVNPHPVAALQLSSVQGLPSWQINGVPDWHTPTRHVSAPLQASPSLQLVPVESNWQLAEQQSPPTRFPSSHCSPGSRVPFPHKTQLGLLDSS